MSGSGQRTIVTAACAFCLWGCGESTALPPPGAPGLVVLHWWEAKGGPPAYLQAHDMKQSGAGFDLVDFTQVLMRLPSDGRVVYVTAPHASYAKGKAGATGTADAVLLDAGTDSDGHPRIVDGPVRFLGTTDGVPFIGRADRAVFDPATQAMRLDKVEIVYDGLHEFYGTATLNRKEPSVSELRPLPPTPALTAAMAALPRPLDLPPIRRKSTGEQPR